MTPANIIRLVWVCVIVSVVGGLVLFGYSCARKQNTVAGLKSEVKAQTQAAKQTKESVKVSNDTQKRVETESEKTKQATQKAVERIDARIETNPVVSGPADADLLRIAREAHQRALGAHCRVQRAIDCTGTAAAP